MTRRLGIAALALLLTMPVTARHVRRFAADAEGPHGWGVGFLTGYLNLTEAQKTQAEAIFQAARTAAEPLRGRLQSAREALQGAVKAGKTDAEIDALAASIGTISGQLAAIHSKAMVKFRAILTPEQIAKLDSRARRRGPRSGD